MENEKDTIVALSTPAGVSGIAVIRLSGKNAIEVADALFRGRHKLVESETHRAHFSRMGKEIHTIDQVVVTVFRAPRSYTGEDVVEISAHGGPYVVQSLVEAIIHAGARPAGPGEFTERAYLNGRMDLTQAEAVADLIHARTEASHRVALSHLEGTLGKRLAGLKEDLEKACAFLELELDFSQEEIELIPREDLQKRLAALGDEIEALLATYARGRICREGIVMTIVGKPNAGKSSILNALLEKERAIVTEFPGTTRDTVEEKMDLEGILIHVIDTAGIRDTEDPVEKEGVRRSRVSLETADLILFIVDGADGLSEEDRVIAGQLRDAGKPVLAILNKSDLSQKTTPEAVSGLVPGAPVLSVSARTAQRIPALITAIRRQILGGDIPSGDEVVITRERHKRRLEEAGRFVRHGLQSLKDDMSQEFVAMDIRGALQALGALIGETTDDDILNRIFSEFCVGK